MTLLPLVAVVRADVMLYSVSLVYKESSNCRLEANVRKTLAVPHATWRSRMMSCVRCFCVDYSMLTSKNST